MTTKRENKKLCFVPGCKNTSKNSSKKFVSVPVKEARRLKWFEAVGRKIHTTKTVFFCCEDHFNMEEDMQNYIHHKLMEGRIIMKPEVVPHIFDCQPDRKRTWESPAALKRARRQLVHDAMEEYDFSEQQNIKVQEECGKANTNHLPNRTASVYLPSSTSNLEETNSGFIGIKVEPEPVVEEMLIYDNCDFSGSYDKNHIEAPYTSQIEPNEEVVDNKLLLYGVKKYEGEDEEEHNNIKYNLQKEYVEVKHTVLNEEGFDVTGKTLAEACVTKTNRECIDNSEEKRQDIIKADSHVNVCVNPHKIEEHFNTTDREENEELLPQVKEEEIRVESGALNEECLIKDEFVEDVDKNETHSFCDLPTRSSTDTDLKCHEKINNAVEQQFLHQKGPFVCELCNKRYKRSDYLVKHQRIHTRERPFSCSFCGKRFVYKSILKEHEARHTQERPFACLACEKSFVLHKDLTAHESIHTNEHPFECQFCNKRFRLKQRLVKHERVHTNERPFACKFCSKQYTLMHVLKYHEASHANVSAFSCGKCGKSFTRKRNLTKHELQHAKEQSISNQGLKQIHNSEHPFSCQFCGKRFPRKLNLVYHEATHTNERQFSCQQCGKAYPHKLHLARHKRRVHTGKGAFKCKLCDKVLPAKDSLKRHEVIHSSARPFRCSVCDKHFARKRNLVEHERTHSSARPHVCDVCDKTFKQKSHLTRHKRIHTFEKQKQTENMNQE